MSSLPLNSGRSSKRRRAEKGFYACTPPYVFKHRPTEYLFQDYSLHVRRTTTSSILGVYILLTAVLAILYFAYQKAPTEKNIYHACLCVLGICLYVFVNTKYLRTRRQQSIVSYMVWVLLLLLAFISLPLGAWNSRYEVRDHPSDGLWQFMFIIYCMYLLLPVNFFVTTAFAFTLSLVHTAVVLIRCGDITQIWTKVLVNGVLLLLTNIIGIKEHHGGEKSQRRSFMACRNYMGSKLESQEQGQRLIKTTEMCLPRFMCSEVCTDLTMYHAIVCPRHIFPKTYDCISIVYINISGLERLYSQTDPSEYINIVNDLAVTFEALCEAYGCLPLTVLGDTYVATSGIPVSDPEGAQSSVNLCLDMIEAVQLVQHSQKVQVDALTGVHFGSVATGTVGTYRWRYKACSSDVMIAKQMALTGSPGKVHITEACIRFLALDQYDVQASNLSHGLSIPTFYLQQSSNIRKYQLSPPVMKLSRKLSKLGNNNSFLRLDTLENEEPFFTQLSRASESKPSMTTCLLKGKAFVHRLTQDFMENDGTMKTFREAITLGTLDQEASQKMSFFTLRFNDRFMELRYGKEFSEFGMSLTFMLLLLVTISILHFTLLSRTMLMLGSMLFLLLFISLLLIFLLSSKLNLLKCKCLSHPTNKLALTLVTVFLIALTAITNLLSCQTDLYHSMLPRILKFPLLSSRDDDSHLMCSDSQYMVLSGITVLFVVVITRMSHVIQAVCLALSTAGYIIIVAYSHNGLFEKIDLSRTASSPLPPSSVLAITALVHFALLHMLIARHNEYTRRLDFIWQHEEMSQYQNAQDMITLRQGVVDNTLPAHVHSYFNSPECIMHPFSSKHNHVGVAFLTVPNFPAFVNEMCINNQPLVAIQVLHDVTSAFDHLLRRGDFHVVEKVYDDSLSFVFVSGLKTSFLNSNQPAVEQEYLIHHLCKLLDLILDMRHCLLQLNAMSGRNLFLRAGVSMGRIVEGVVGFKCPQYNIWGPAVEVAKKLELSSKPNHLQVNKEVAHILKRRFQFQARAQGSMPVFADLQPYVVLGRRLQSVIASDNVSLASDANVNHRSQVHDQSFGSLSQAETVLVSSQQHLLGSSHSRMRKPSYEARVEPVANGIANPTNSSSSTPSGSFTRNISRDSSKEGITHGWKLPPTPTSVKHGNSVRPMSPELPAVHYSKTRTPASTRPDNRGTIILTQANFSGEQSNNLGADPGVSSMGMVYPSTVNTHASFPKMANVINTDMSSITSPKRTTPLGSVGEQTGSFSGNFSRMSPITHGRITPISMHSPVVPGAITPNSAHSSQSHINFNGNPPSSPPPQNIRISPAVSYTRTNPSALLPSRTPSRASSSKSSVNEKYSSSNAHSYNHDDNALYGDIKDTEPLLGSNQQVGLSEPPQVQKDMKPRCNGPELPPKINHSNKKRPEEEVTLSSFSAQKEPMILGLDRIMMTSVYSDKMQTSMEGNVSSTSTSPDDDSPRVPQKLHRMMNSELSSVNNDPSLSPVLKHQLNRFAKNRESGIHKSPHLPRKHSASSMSKKLSTNTISSLSPPSTPVRETASPQLQNVSYDCQTNKSEAASSCISKSSSGTKSQSSVINKAADTQWAGARPKQYNSNQANKANEALSIPPPPIESATESELSDDDNVNVDGNLNASATEYDNMYSTDTGTYNSRVFMPYQYDRGGNDSQFNSSSKFVAKLQKLKSTGCTARDLYSEVESDTADCESLVGDTDYEYETLAPPTQEGHPLQKLQWTESKLLALLKPLGSNISTLGSTLRHCRSMELLPCENGDLDCHLPKRLPRGKNQSNRASQNLDSISITSSMLGSEFSRSDPYLSDIGTYELECDSFLNAEEDRIVKRRSNNIDVNQFDHIDFDDIKITESTTTKDYLQSLQHHIDQHQNNLQSSES